MSSNRRFKILNDRDFRNAYILRIKKCFSVSMFRSKNFSINVPCSSILDQERNLKFKNFHDRDFRNTLYPQPSSLKIKKKNPQLLKFHPWKEKEKRKKAFPSDRESTLLGKWLDLLSLFSRWYKNAFHYFYRLETRERERERI